MSAMSDAGKKVIECVRTCANKESDMLLMFVLMLSMVWGVALHAWDYVLCVIDVYAITV
jgi:hypothetical protein